MRPRNALLGAGGCLMALALVWFAAFHVGPFRHADRSAFLQFYDLQGHSSIAWLVRHLVRPFDPNPYVFLVLVPVVVALLRGRPRVVVGIGAIILGATGSTELLKHALAPGTWPSGHCTAAMSLVLASVLAVPARLRPATAAFGASLGIAVGYSVVAAGMHFPSEVLGGFLVAGAWTLAVVGGLLAAEHRWPIDRAHGHPPVSLRAVLGAPGAVLLGASVLGMVLVVTHPHDVVSYARVHQAFVLEAAGIAALSLAVSTAVLLSVRR